MSPFHSSQPLFIFISTYIPFQGQEPPFQDPTSCTTSTGLLSEVAGLYHHNGMDIGWTNALSGGPSCRATMKATHVPNYTRTGPLLCAPIVSIVSIMPIVSIVPIMPIMPIMPSIKLYILNVTPTSSSSSSSSPTPPPPQLTGSCMNRRPK